MQNETVQTNNQLVCECIPEPMKSKTIKRILSVIFILGLLALGGYEGRRWYRVLRQNRLINQARHFLAVSDYKNAELCLVPALQHNPKDPNACRLMADLAEAANSPSALIWRSRVVEYNPASLDDRLALAETAIQKRDFATATGALDGVNAAGKTTASFHSVAGDLAASVNQLDVAEAHFREVARLEPTNVAPLLNIAILQLRGSNAPGLAEARSFLRNLASNPTNSELRWKALRNLTLEAMRHRETNAALAFSKELLEQTNAVFADQIIRLDVLSDTRNAEFKSVLATVERQAAGDPTKVAKLASWETTKVPVATVLARLRSLPKATQTNQTVAVVMAECYEGTQDWRGLQSFLGPQTWGETDFVRHGLMARALRGQEMVDTAKIEWDKALKAAQGSRQRLVMLLDMAMHWDWQEEQEELLWTIVNQYPGDKGAFQTLAKTLFSGRRTRSLLQLYNQVAKRDPSSLEVRNNVAFVALLLDAQEFKPHDLAREVYRQAPTNSACATTYALSLLLQKKNAEALKVIEGLDPRELESPSTACFYGLALQASGNREKARKYLEIASKAPMLPEQRKLLTGAGL